MRPVPRVLAAILLCLSSGVTLSGSRQTSSVRDTPFAFAPAPTWPGGDSFLWAGQQWQLRREASERRRLFPDSPNTVVWLAHAERVGEALDTLARVAARRPERLADALEYFVPHQIRMDATGVLLQRARAVVRDVQARLATLDRETAARTAFALVDLEVTTAERDLESPTRVRELVERFAGTEAARLAELDLVTNSGVTPDMLAQLEARAATAPGSLVAAKARYLRAFNLAHNGSILVLQGGDRDPTARILEVIEIATDLTSGRYPPSRWVDEADRLVPQIFLFEPSFTEANARRAIDALAAYATDQVQATSVAKSAGRIEGIVTRLIPQIAASLPDGAAVVERVFAAAARDWDDKAAANVMRVNWLTTETGSLPWPVALAPDSPSRRDEIDALLASAARMGDGHYSRLALATLAERAIAERATLESARTHLQAFVERFPAVAETPVAALRLGQVEELLAQPAAAAAAFARAATLFADRPLTRPFGLALAARVSEAAGQFDAALRYYTASLDEWSVEIPEQLGLELPRSAGAPPPRFGDQLPGSFVRRTDVERRVDQLSRSLASEGGAEVEQGRHLAQTGQWREAVVVLEDVARKYAGRPAALEAGAILNGARLQAALQGSAPDRPPAERKAALAELDTLATGAFDPATGTAAIGAATLRMLQGNETEARSQMVAALRRWASESARRRSEPEAGSLEADVLAVRDAVFTPLGNPVLATGWNASEWPRTVPDFVIIPARLPVLVAGGERRLVDVSRPPPAAGTTLFFTPEDAEVLSRMVAQLGGTERQQPRSIMEAPNQPAGGARSIVQWWNTFFPTRPGHWGGVELMTYPAIANIEFTNAERTRALVPVAVGYSGGTIVLEKERGVWVAKDLVNLWIT